MLKAGRPRTLAPAYPQMTPTANDASKSTKKKLKVADKSSSGVKISLPAGVTALNDCKSLIRGANQFLLLRDVQLLNNSSVSTTVDRCITSAFQLRQRVAMRERDARLEELERRVANLSANKDRLQMEHKAEVDNLLGQLNTLMVKCKNIADDVVLQTRANLMQEYKDGKSDI
ncbi:hypothetical protein ACOSQ4_004793 [Xanthoceras sorbifolium]